MFKKLLLVGLVAAAAVVVFKGTRIYRYAKEEVASWRDAAEDSIPVEKKIAMMRQDVNALNGDIERVKTDLATSIVKVREQTAQVADLRQAVTAEEKGLLARGEALKGEGDKRSGFVTATAVGEAKEQLKRDVALHVKRKNQLDAMEQALAKNQKIKETLEKQFDELLRQKETLKAEIDAVEADYKNLQLQQMESKYQTDDTKLAKVKEDLRKLRHKLDVEKEKLRLTPKAVEGPSAGTAESVDEILAPVTGSKDKIGKTE